MAQSLSNYLAIGLVLRLSLRRRDLLVATFASFLFQIASYAGECPDPENSACISVPRTCKDDKTWAIDAVDGDLMLQEMVAWRKTHPNSKKTKIAIVDSGVNEKFESNLLASISYFPGSDKVVPPGLAVSSHGYSVASIYASPGGLYPNSELGVYGVSIRGTESGVDTGTAEKAYVDACLRGYKIINASHGSAPNLYAQRFELKRNSLLDELSKNGCLLIKAAGNESNRVADFLNAADSEDPLVRVASIRFSGGLAEHTNLGEISVPGEKIYTFEYSPNGACPDGLGSLVSGTSFAGPLAGAIYANVREVLSENKEFSLLSGKDQVAIWNRIVNTTSVGPSRQVNGYRAVKLAMLWDGKNAAIASLQSELQNDPVCVERDAKTKGQERLRQRLALCSNLSSHELTPAVQEILDQNRIFSLAVWVEASNRSGFGRISSVSSLAFEDFWRKYFKERPRFNYSDFKSSLERIRTSRPSELDYTGRIDAYLILRSFLTDSVRIDDLVANSALEELDAVPEFWRTFPQGIRIPGFLSEENAAHELKKLFEANIAPDILAEGLVTRRLKGRQFGFHAIMRHSPYRSQEIQKNLERLLTRKVEDQTPEDLMIYAHTGAVQDSYHWLESIIKSQRFSEARLKEDSLYRVDLTRKRGYISEEQASSLRAMIEEKFLQRR